MAVDGGTSACGAGFSAGFVVPSPEAAAVGEGLGEELELVGALLAGSDEPALVPLPVVELPELPFCGAPCDEALPSPVPDCWKGGGSAGPLQAASAVRGSTRDTNHDERWSMS